MFSAILESVLGSLSAATVTDFFLLLIFGVLIFALITAAKGSNSSFTHQAPNILTSLGILGTFTGIVIGLLNFDFSASETIDESLPGLLNGLKTAFITSLGGMLAAIVFKGVDSLVFVKRRQEMEIPDEVTPGDIHKQLKDTNANLLALKTSLTGEEEGSLVGVMKLARSDMRDFRTELKDERILERTRHDEFAEKLFKEMNNFAELLSKSATEAVIEALKVVIEDFNKNLTEQFGENFKRLDESVKKLVEWQQQYMVQMTQMSEHYAEGVTAIDSTKEAVTVISNKSAEIPKIMEGLEVVLKVNQHQIDNLAEHLKAFVEMKQSATEAMPEIQGRLDTILTQLSDSSEKMKIALLEGVTEFDTAVRGTNEVLKTTASDMATNTESIKETLEDSASSLSAATKEMMDSLDKGATSLRELVASSIEGALEAIQSSIAKSVGTLENELERSIKAVGNGIDDTHRVMVENLEQSAKHLQSSLNDSVNQVLEGTKKSVEQAINAVPNQIEGAVNSLGQSVNDRFAVFDEQTTEQLTKVVRDMGNALAQVTNRFVQDYTQLVNQMNDIVRNQPERNE